MVENRPTHRVNSNQIKSFSSLGLRIKIFFEFRIMAAYLECHFDGNNSIQHIKRETTLILTQSYNFIIQRTNLTLIFCTFYVFDHFIYFESRLMWTVRRVVAESKWNNLIWTNEQLRNSCSVVRSDMRRFELKYGMNGRWSAFTVWFWILRTSSIQTGFEMGTSTPKATTKQLLRSEFVRNNVLSRQNWSNRASSNWKSHYEFTIFPYVSIRHSISQIGVMDFGPCKTNLSIFSMIWHFRRRNYSISPPKRT